MIELKNEHAEKLYSLRGKTVYVEIVNPLFQGISDLGEINAVIQDNTDIEIYGEYEDFSLTRIGLKVDHENDLEEDDGEDSFLFKVKYPLTTTKLYFFEYEEE